MQSRQGLRQPLIIACQPAKARHPSEASLNDPAARQQYEAAFGFRPFDDLQPDAVGVGVGRRLFPRIALIDERHASTGSAHRFDRLAGDGLDRFRQCGDLRAFRFVGGRDDHGQQLTQRINRHVDFAAPLPPAWGGRKGGTLMPVIAGARCAPPFPPLRGGQGGRLHRARVNDHRARRRRAPPPFPLPAGGGREGDCIVRASTITARGAGARPPLSPPLRGGGGGGKGGRSATTRCGASSVMKVR